MNLFHLRYFVTLAKSQNYTRAARQLNITQPSLSNAIHGLEAELGLAGLKSIFETDFKRHSEPR
ncbi:LysR family transcriptional regulator, partial [Lacticaseibacillus paracasei]|uniref:LysR family transcriptional regulator n=1 Tax=Lacticaseibacillus paracasei TaxID=1597 RepID=UPI002018EB6E